MRIWLVFFLFIFCGLLPYSVSFASNTIEIDLVDRHIRFIDFHFADKVLDGDFLFQFQRENESLRFEVKGSDITFNNQYIPWGEARLNKRGRLLFVEKLQLPHATATGVIDLTKQELSLDVEGSWQENSKFLQGDIFVKAKVWGKISNLVTSGHLTVEDGVYEGQEFQHLRLDFLGKPPILNITDSEIILKDGSIFEYVDAVLDLRDLSNPVIPDPEFVSQKVYFGEWQVFGEDKNNVGLKRKLDSQFDVFLQASETDQEDGRDIGAVTELRYNWKDDQFLKLRMEENRAILGFEKRRSF